MLATYYLGDQIEEKKMGGEFGTYGGLKHCIDGFDGKILGKENTWKK
jgi:hypothetical protein